MLPKLSTIQPTKPLFLLVEHRHSRIRLLSCFILGTNVFSYPRDLYNFAISLHLDDIAQVIVNSVLELTCWDDFSIHSLDVVIIVQSVLCSTVQQSEQSGCATSNRIGSDVVCEHL